MRLNVAKQSLFVFILLLFAADCFAASTDRPKTRYVEIKSGITEVVLDIYPTLGVKCIFPWVLSEQSKDLPFTGRLVNENIFSMNRPPGQNYVVFYVGVQGGNIEGALSDAFINIAGFHIVFRLRATFDDRKHYSTVVFKLSEAERLDLIERSIQRRMEALRRDFEQKEKELDKRADMLALKRVGRMSITRPEKHRIKTEEVLKLPNGDKVVFYCDTILDYGSIFVIPVEVENDSNIMPLYIQNISLEKYDKSNASIPLISEFEVADLKLGVGDVTRGFIVTDDRRLVDSGDSKCTVFTDRGKVGVQW